MQTRKNEIHGQIHAIHSRATALDSLKASIKSQIDEVYKKSLAELDNVIKKKSNVLLGDELELKRQLGEIQLLENFLNYQQEGDATTFLFNWARHQMYRTEMHDFPFFKTNIDVQLDAKVSIFRKILNLNSLLVPYQL